MDSPNISYYVGNLQLGNPGLRKLEVVCTDLDMNERLVVVSSLEHNAVKMILEAGGSTSACYLQCFKCFHKSSFVKHDWLIKKLMGLLQVSACAPFAKNLCAPCGRGHIFLPFPPHQRSILYVQSFPPPPQIFS